MVIRKQKQAKPPLIHQRWPALAVALVVPLIAALIGGLATSQSVATWYPFLKKPRWNPPSWLFAPVWNLLFLLMGVASWLVWQKGTSTRNPGASPHPAMDQQTKQALASYGIQLSLNALWAVLFFGLRRIDLALVEVVALWGAILVTLRQFYQVRPVAAWLLIPYQLWVTFAAILNARIWQLNRKK